VSTIGQIPSANRNWDQILTESMQKRVRVASAASLTSAQALGKNMENFVDLTVIDSQASEPTKIPMRNIVPPESTRPSQNH
jgi:hypothetical protein